jgi:hypothetical protein
MKPYAKYVFEKIPEAATRYILREPSGADIPDFPAIWTLKTHRYCGEKYIGFKPTDQSIPGQRFTHCLCLERNRMIVFFNFRPRFPNQSWGSYANDAILIKRNKKTAVLTLLFFKDMKDESYSLYKEWTAGNLDELVETNDFPIQLELDWDS